MKKTILLCLIVLLLGGCSLGRSPRTTFFMLASSAESQLKATQENVTGPRVAIGSVVIPGYLDRPQIFIRDGNSVLVELEEFNQWSEPFGNGVTRVLCDAVSATLAPRKGLAFPMRSPLEPQWRVSVEINRFDGAPGGEVMLDAGWTLINATSGNEIQSGRFVERTPAGQTLTSLVQAHSTLLGRFGQHLGTLIP